MPLHQCFFNLFNAFFDDSSFGLLAVIKCSIWCMSAQNPYVRFCIILKVCIYIRPYRNCTEKPQCAFTDLDLTLPDNEALYCNGQTISEALPDSCIGASGTPACRVPLHGVTSIIVRYQGL